MGASCGPPSFPSTCLSTAALTPALTCFPAAPQQCASLAGEVQSFFLNAWEVRVRSPARVAQLALLGDPPSPLHFRAAPILLAPRLPHPPAAPFLFFFGLERIGPLPTAPLHKLRLKGIPELPPGSGSVAGFTPFLFRAPSSITETLSGRFDFGALPPSLPTRPGAASGPSASRGRCPFKPVPRRRAAPRPLRELPPPLPLLLLSRCSSPSSSPASSASSAPPQPPRARSAARSLGAPQPWPT